MLKKEINSVLRYTLYWLAILASIMLLLMASAWLGKSWETFREGFLLVLQMLLLVYSLLLGLSFFSEEKEQKGMEYLLSLPYTRLQIVRIKLLVRLAAVGIVFVPFLILFKANPFNSILMPVLGFCTVYFVFFTSSFSLSCLLENNLVGFMVAFFFSAFYLLSAGLVYLAAFFLTFPAGNYFLNLRDFLNLEISGDNTWSFWLILLVLILPFLAAFFRTARSIDLRQSRRKKTFAWTFGLLMPLAFLIAVGLAYANFDFFSAYGNYYLTANKRLLEIPLGYAMHIHDQKGSKKISVPGQIFAEVLGEKAGYIYIASFQKKGPELLQLQESSGQWQSLYKCPDGFQLGYGDTAGSLEQDVFVLETPGRNQGALRLLIYDTQSCKLRRIKYGAVQWSWRYQMIGAGRTNGKSFVLIGQYRNKNLPVQRLWEDGQAEKLAGTEHSRCLYLGGKLLIDNKDGVQIFSLTTTDQPKLEKFLPGLFIPGWYQWHGMDEFNFSAALAAREVLLSKGGEQYNVLNLQTYEQKIISTNPGTAFHALVWPFFQITTGNGYSIVRCQDGLLETLGSLQFKFKDIRDGTWFGNGIVTRQNKKVRAYAFPDLHELIFPDL